MSIEKYLDQMKKIQNNILEYIDYETDIEEKYQNLINLIDDNKIHDNQFEIKLIFYLILKISKNHHREPGFFSKIEQILTLFKNDIQKYFSNSELFHIFKSNKRLILFLIEENLLIIDEYIVKKIINNTKYIEAKYPQYFQPEIQPFINEKWFPKYNKDDKQLQNNYWVEELKKELPENFYEKRRIGENDDEICKLIQKDLIEEFIIYVNKNCYPTQSTIKSSIYETNNFLIKKENEIINSFLHEEENVTLIEYAVYFGSIQIFNYLRQNGAKLKQSLWIFAVHGQSEEIIHFLEDNQIWPSKNEQIFYESIKCHHIDVANYIQSNYLQNEKEYSNDTFINCIKYYNFIFMQFSIIKKNIFWYLCKYDYYLFVLTLFKEIDIDINEQII